MEQQKKIRLGSGKKRKENWLTLSLCISDAMQHTYEYNGKKYVNLNVNIANEPNEYGKDVAVTLNDYKKETTKVVNTVSNKIKIDDGDIPF